MGMRTYVSVTLGLVLGLCAGRAPALADGLGDLLGLVGGETISEDEARAIAEEEAGRSLADAVFEKKDLGTTVHGVLTLPREPDGSTRQYEVDLARGVFVSWSVRGGPMSHPRPDDEPAITRDQGVQAASAEARRHLGAQADTLQWKTNRWSPLSRGEVHASADDRRLSVRASFDLTTGEMRSYWQMVPPAGPVHEPKVTLEEATEIVRQRMGGGEITIVGEPRLTQAPKMPVWSIRAVSPDGAESIFLLNGFTGEVLEEGRFLGDEGAHTDALVPTPRSLPWLPVAAGAALLLAAGVGLVLLRRRR